MIKGRIRELNNYGKALKKAKEKGDDGLKYSLKELEATLLADYYHLHPEKKEGASKSPTEEKGDVGLAAFGGHQIKKRCHNCGKWGHLSKNCYEKKNDQGGGKGRGNGRKPRWHNAKKNPFHKQCIGCHNENVPIEGYTFDFAAEASHGAAITPEQLRPFRPSAGLLESRAVGLRRLLVTPARHQGRRPAEQLVSESTRVGCALA